MTAAEPLRRRALRWGAHLTGLLLLGWFLRGVSWGELGLALRQTSGRALVGARVARARPAAAKMAA